MPDARPLRTSILTFAAAIFAASPPAPAEAAGVEGALRAVPSQAPGWPQFRGPRRDAVSPERGLLEAWPPDGPPLLWRIGGLGRGYSSPIVVEGRIYVTGDVGDELRVFALDLEGKVLWKSANGRSWRGSYPGSRSSLAFDEGRLYHMNAHGRVAAFDAESGREIWAVEALERFGARNIGWGLAECVLIDGPRAIVAPGGRKAAMAALEKRTGDTLWMSGPVTLDPEETAGGAEFPDADEPVDSASHASSVLFELGARRFVAGVSSRHIYCVEAETGALAWKHPVRTVYQVLASAPVVLPDGLFLTAPDSGGGRLYRLRLDGPRLRGEAAWTATIDTCAGGVIAAGGVLFGSWYREHNGFGAVDPRTGETLYRTRELVRGSAVFADGKFHYLAEDGTVALIEAGREGFRIASRFRLPGAEKGDAWAHPVILDGRLYLRYHEALECRDVRAPAPPAGEIRW